MGEEYVMLPFLADEELISISGWKRIAAAFSRVAESKHDEKRDLRITAKLEDVWADGYVNLSNLRELNVRTLRNELEWPMLLARQFVRMVTAMSFVEQRGVRVQEDGSGKFFSCTAPSKELLSWIGFPPRPDPPHTPPYTMKSHEMTRDRIRWHVT